MSAMVERVARAMYDASKHPQQTSWEELPETFKGHWRDIYASAAIEAMQTKCFECGEPVTLVCLACQQPTT